MEAVALVLMIVGLVVAAIGGIMLLVAAFKTSVLWGLGSLFVPLVSLIFVFMHWNVAKKGFLINIVGLVLMGVGFALSPKDFAAPPP